MLLLLLACQPSHSPAATEAAAPSPPAPAAAETPALAATPAAVQTMTVTLEPGEMSYDEAAGTATFSPGQGRQQADYTTWVLDLASLEAVLGGRPTAPTAVTVEVATTDVQRSTPADGMPSPMGGFTYTTHTGKVVAKGG